MTLRNFLVGVPVMLLCLVVQVAVVFWCVRYCARRSAQGPGNRLLLATVRPLAVAMLAMMTANVLQIALWGWLFVLLGEFEDLYPAIYHSAVNFTSLGYGDVVMNQEWKLLGPLEAANGVLMMAMTAASLTAVLQNVIRSQTDAIVAGRHRDRDSGN
jgi:Ion channel